jgi:hypothetical protein
MTLAAVETWPVCRSMMYIDAMLQWTEGMDVAAFECALPESESQIVLLVRGEVMLVAR